MEFLPFKPGLVGGHYQVDPYYLAQRAQNLDIIRDYINRKAIE
jgi:UDP-N-acetyl-D-mannosaminuronate dehydrogenase